MNKILIIIIQFSVVLFAISLHEAAHGWMAWRLGDPTARMQGRVTLNPLAHIDPVGTILFPLILALIGAPVFGWAKPVMVNPRNLGKPRRDHMLVSAAGPAANIATAVICIGLFVFLRKTAGILPKADSIIGPVALVFFYLVIINIYLAVFNLIPIPPLDGSGILEGLLKGEALVMYNKIRPYGFLILLALIYLGFLEIIARPIIRLVLKIML